MFVEGRVLWSCLAKTLIAPARFACFLATQRPAQLRHEHEERCGHEARLLISSFGPCLVADHLEAFSSARVALAAGWTPNGWVGGPPILPPLCFTYAMEKTVKRHHRHHHHHHRHRHRLIDKRNHRGGSQTCAPPL